MSLEITVAMAGARVVEKLLVAGIELDGELEDRARAAAECAVQLQLHGMAGLDVLEDQKMLAVRLQSLKSAGATRAADGILEALRELLLEGFALL